MFKIQQYGKSELALLYFPGCQYFTRRIKQSYLLDTLQQRTFRCAEGVRYAGSL